MSNIILFTLFEGQTTLHSCAACAPFSNGQAHKRGGTCQAAGQPPKQSPCSSWAVKCQQAGRAGGFTKRATRFVKPYPGSRSWLHSCAKQCLRLAQADCVAYAQARQHCIAAQRVLPFPMDKRTSGGGGTCKAAGQPPKQSPNARCAMQLREHTGKPTKPQHRCSLADKRRTRSQCRWFAGLGLTAAQGVRPDISFPRNVRNVKC